MVTACGVNGSCLLTHESRIQHSIQEAYMIESHDWLSAPLVRIQTRCGTSLLQLRKQTTIATETTADLRRLEATKSIMDPPVTAILIAGIWQTIATVPTDEVFVATGLSILPKKPATSA